MRIAYLSFESPSEFTGVGKKMTRQSIQWSSAGHEVVHFVLNSPLRDVSSRVRTQYVFRRSRFAPLIEATLNTPRLKTTLKHYRPDLIYMRQMIWFPGLASILRSYRVVQEVNSDIESELHLIPGARGFAKRMLYMLTKLLINDSVGGVVYVTEELSKRIPFPRARSLVISNGYTFERIPPPKLVHKPGQPVNLIFVGSPGQSWHGLDDLLILARSLPEFTFHIVVPDFLPADIPENVICHGHLYGDALAHLYGYMTAAIGSLALHRKGMEEACPLKCREYVAHQLPIVARYHDTDLSGAPYFLQLSKHTAASTQVSATEVRDFISSWAGRRFPVQDAVSRVDDVPKEFRRLAFFESLVSA